MCIVIDICSLASVFEENSKNHLEFKPILDWIIRGKGTVIYGGTKYKRELPHKYIRFLNELAKKSKVREVDEKRVDEKQAELEKLVNHKNFDDPHIIAIIIVSGCQIICSTDDRAYPFFKMKELYPKNFTRPKIYSGLNNKDLLCDENIVDACKPCAKLKKNLVDAIKI